MSVVIENERNRIQKTTVSGNLFVILQSFQISGPTCKVYKLKHNRAFAGTKVTVICRSYRSCCRD